MRSGCVHAALIAFGKDVMLERPSLHADDAFGAQRIMQVLRGLILSCLAREWSPLRRGAVS